MANPLSMYVPIKQDPDTQKLAADVAKNFVAAVKAGLDKSQIVHYAKLVLIPNTDGSGTLAIMLSTVFDGAMNPYLKFFWEQPGINAAIQGVASLALDPPDPPISDLDSFQNFIDSVNLSEPADLYQAYTKTVKEINAT